MLSGLSESNGVNELEIGLDVVNVIGRFNFSGTEADKTAYKERSIESFPGVPSVWRKLSSRKYWRIKWIKDMIRY